MALTIPTGFKLVQLKSIAVKCGISSSGTKTVLATRLIDSIVPGDANIKKSTRILSIDMGIRNLAYCVLDVPAKSSEKPSVIAWKRIAVTAKPTKDIEATEPPPKETFEPIVFAKHAYNLLRKRLLLHEPQYVLIERQRFRSMGGSAVLEWTVRVNMFESMLYAVAQTLSSENLWTGRVQPIAPGKVGPFWIGTDDAQVVDGEEAPLRKVRTGKNAKARNKGAKIDLVQQWLSNNKMVKLGTDEAKATGEAYIEKWHRLPGRQAKGKMIKKDAEEELGKLDDLADSLLQGMAWIHWEQNKRKILKVGFEAFEASDTV